MPRLEVTMTNDGDRFLRYTDPDAILRARDEHPRHRNKRHSKSVSLYGCYFVVPFPQGWELMVCNRLYETDGSVWIFEFWRRTVVPKMVEAWSKWPKYRRPVIDSELAPLGDAFPKGLVASDWESTRKCEIWHAGDVEPWMGVTYKMIEDAFDPKKQWSWIRHAQLGCDPNKIADAMQLLRLPRTWKPVADAGK